MFCSTGVLRSTFNLKIRITHTHTHTLMQDQRELNCTERIHPVLAGVLLYAALKPLAGTGSPLLPNRMGSVVAAGTAGL